jgi:hypothetical protein
VLRPLVQLYACNSDSLPFRDSTALNAKNHRKLILLSLEWRVVRPLVGAIEMEHLFMDARTAHSVRAEIATRRIAVVLGSIASIMDEIEVAAR